MAVAFKIGDRIRLTETLHQVAGHRKGQPSQALATVPEGTTGQVVGYELVTKVLSVTLEMDAGFRDVVWLVPATAVRAFA